jgi:tryptophanyl-tRNA synthetase
MITAQEEEAKIVLTGDRPTGALHLGHYFGSLINRRELSKQHRTFLMIADVQALTDNWDDPSKVSSNVKEVLLDNLALGLDMSNTTIFIQSQIPAIAELTVFFGNLVTLARLKRNPTVKSEITQKSEKFGADGESLTYGFLGYPISQAADILSMRSHIIPVGEDQLPMIEQTREIASKFNRIYGEVFPLPVELLSVGKRIIGLDGDAKMSKSLNNGVYLCDSPEVTMQKIKKAKTDSILGITYDPINRPEISNLVQLYALTQAKNISEVIGELEHLQSGEFKMKLATSINDYFAEFRAKRNELQQNQDYLQSVLTQGYEQANERAEQTMKLVRAAMKIQY